MEKELVQELVRKVLPSYEIMDMLGEGSFGAVYRIKDSLKERAVKIIQLNAAASIEKGAVTTGSVKIERDFRHIVENYERIACDEIVSVYDFYKVSTGEERNQAAAYAIVVMELYPHNLLDYVMEHFRQHKRLLDIDTVKVIMEKLALLLGNLYTKHGFLFEDLKPENLLVKHQGGDVKVVVGDIGGLKSLRSVSATGSQVTLSYCAAEVIRGRQKPDLRSIVYSYGLISYFILEGHLPYEDAGVSERIDLIRSKGPVLDRSDTPDDIKGVIEQCLSFEPDDRYQNFEEILEVLQGKAGNQGPAFSGQTIDLESFLTSAPPASGPAQARNIPFPRTQKSAALNNPFAGMRAALTRQHLAEPKKGMESIRISGEHSNVSKIDAEVAGVVVRSGDLFKLVNQSCKISGDIRVENGGVLLIDNAKLFFEEHAGILSSGTVRAKNSFFSALDVKKRWANIALNPLDMRLNSIEGCKFLFGSGRSGKSLKSGLSVRGHPLHDDYTYGGGLFIAEAKESLVVINDSSFYSCRAHEGGGLYCLKAQPSMTNCTFENCSAGLSGGGISCTESSPTIRNCRVHSCSAQREGGGMMCRSANPVVEKSTFENCSTKYLYGGGMFCFESSPTVKDCRFSRCSASKDGGGIFCDEKSKPKILFPSFANCRPKDTNYTVHGRS